MKTPMQELLKEVINAREIAMGIEFRSALDFVRDAIEQDYLEKEKDVMCDFVEYCDEANRNYQDTEESWCEDLTIDDMFDKRFNTEEK